MAALGPMPCPADEPADLDRLALWAAALVNPLPALGVAYEVRPQALAARSTAERLRVAANAIRQSIGHLDGTARLW